MRYSISLPRSLIDRIDELRGDVPRSKYIQRILEKHLLLPPLKS